MDEITLENKKKKLIFRCGHRGTKEMDIFLGQFAKYYVPNFNVDQLTMFETFITNPDPDIYNWLTGQEQLPQEWDNEISQLLLKFHLNHNQT